MGCDLGKAFYQACQAQFQSTHPVWDATCGTTNLHLINEFQSTHPVWDATLKFDVVTACVLFQSTHPVWDATYCFCFPVRSLKFQSTHPVWDATRMIRAIRLITPISIHASRMGCDRRLACRCRPHRNFNPRIPYGMRLLETFETHHISLFQSTHPVWDATRAHVFHADLARISIHASHMGCDRVGIPRGEQFFCYFNPRIPYGMRPSTMFPRSSTFSNFNPRIPYGMRPPFFRSCTVRPISIHASRMGCDLRRTDAIARANISIHASRMGCDGKCPAGWC